MKCWLAVLSVALAAGAGAAGAGAAEDRNARIARLQDAVLAPCCYTEPVSKHQSEIALKMRLEIARWVSEGRTDREILDAYIGNYGSKVLVDPRTKPGAWTPWVPWLTAILAVSFGFWLVRRWRPAPAVGGAPLSAPELAALPDFDEDE